MSHLSMRLACEADFDQIWPFFQHIIRAGDTYAYDVDMDRSCAFQVWMQQPKQTWVAEWRAEDGTNRIVGSYYLKDNQGGNGRHVANAGYMVDSRARGQGVASRMCQHSLQQATSLGYLAMQFNCVVSTNHVAIHLWKTWGFEIVGRCLKAFQHPQQGWVDALVMYRWLQTDAC